MTNIASRYVQKRYYHILLQFFYQNVKDKSCTNIFKDQHDITETGDLEGPPNRPWMTLPQKLNQRERTCFVPVYFVKLVKKSVL